MFVHDGILLLLHGERLLMLQEYIKTLITTISTEIDDPNSKSDYKMFF